MEDRLAKQIARQKQVRAMIETPRPKVVTPLEEALAKQRADAQPYIDRITGVLAAANKALAERDADVERLTRSLRVLRATAEQYGDHYPKWQLFASMVQRALNGERL